MRPLLIAHSTFREATRDRVMAGMIVVGIVFMLVVQLLSPLALGEGRRLTVDLGLSMISVLGLLVVLLVGTQLVAREIDRRTIYNVLTRPIPRHDYLIGKWAGLSASLWVVSMALAFVLWLILMARGHAADGPAVFQAAYLACLELTVVTSLAILFSALSTPVLSALYTLALFMVGEWSYDIREVATKLPSEISRGLDVLANLVPNLPLFNMRTLAATGVTTSWEHLAVATAYALVYCVSALCLATAAFETRDFK